MRVPEVLVVIVSYRSAALTIQCLESLAEERRAGDINLHAIVVDNASGDAVAIQRALQSESLAHWVTLVEAEKNGGFAYGNNLGFRHALERGDSPDYFYMLNPDAVVRPGGVRALVQFLEASPEVGIVGSSFENPDGSHWPRAFRFPTIWSEVDQALNFGVVSRLLRNHVVAKDMTGMAEPVDWVSGASMMVRRSVIERMGGLDEGYFLYFEETDLCYRTRAAGYSVWYVPESRVMHMRGQSTGVMEHDAQPKALPDYWYNSRRRYFVKTHGLGYALATDAAAVLAYGLGSIKLALQRRPERRIPGFCSALLRSWRQPAPASHSNTSLRASSNATSRSLDVEPVSETVGRYGDDGSAGGAAPGGSGSTSEVPTAAE